MVRTKILMKSLFNSLRAKWDAHLHKRYLKKMGWTQEAYERRTDPRCNMNARTDKQYYHGYPYVHAYDSPTGLPWSQYSDWLEGLDELRRWCREHCRGAWRDDILRGFRQTPIGLSGPEETEWHLNELANDALFVAFECEEDYTFFLLRWT